jgi:hypothetical protein
MTECFVGARIDAIESMMRDRNLPITVNTIVTYFIIADLESRYSDPLIQLDDVTASKAERGELVVVICEFKEEPNQSINQSINQHLLKIDGIKDLEDVVDRILLLPCRLRDDAPELFEMSKNVNNRTANIVCPGRIQN